jgi:NAD(P)H dehydrogenase (quinone)
LGAPRDVAEQQAKVARADALAFVAPVYFMGFPAILKGWIERVFSLGFAFGMTAQAWRGDIAGRLPLLKHEKALIMQTTIWNEESYEAGLKAAMKVLIDEYALHYPGIQRIEHECPRSGRRHPARVPGPRLQAGSRVLTLARRA